jgi:hypothetical protein
MNRSTRTTTARVAGALVLALAIAPAMAVGAAQATEQVPADSVVIIEPSENYADEVAVGPATKIAAPGVVANATESPDPAPTEDQVAAPLATEDDEPVPSEDSTEIPEGAEVIETDSIQNDDEVAPGDDVDEVAVLGNRIQADTDGTQTLANTGPGEVAVQAAFAVALLLLGSALIGGPQAWRRAQLAFARRH